MATAPKDTIYIDIDDEITGIIDKLRASGGKVVALVLPKRAAVFQSIVNMKLLKRAADETKKNVVLITSEAGLLPLAGAAGIHVAKTLASKPEIPQPPQADDGSEETVQESDADAGVTANAGNQPIGKLAGLATAGAVDDMETLELDDDEAPENADDGPAGKATPATTKKDKKLHIPNFERFRLLLAGGVLLFILLVFGLVQALSVLPKAVISIKTDATNLNVNLSLTADSGTTSFDPAGRVLPAKQVSQQKTYTQQAPASGQKNNGNKASGSITVTNCGGSSIDIPAGTGFSSGSFTFISQTSISVPASNYTFSHQCKNDGTATTNVIAQGAGSAYNLSAGAYSIAGSPAYATAQGSAMTGGTDNIVKVISQADIDSAKSKINTTDTTVKQALQNQLVQASLYAIGETFNAGTPAVTTSANVGDTVDSVTVTEQVTYTMLGVHETDLKAVVDINVKGQIDTAKQIILSEGLEAASFTVQSTDGKSAQLSMQTVAVAGPDLNVQTLLKQVAGKKPGDIKSQLQGNPDVTRVDVKLSPFWVTSVPKNTKKITITIAKPTVTKPNSANANP